MRRVTFTYFQVNRIVNIFDELLAPPRFLVDKSFEVQDEDGREFFKGHSSTDLHLAERKEDLSQKIIMLLNQTGEMSRYSPSTSSLDRLTNG